MDDKERFDGGMKIRREVLGAAYVDRGMAAAYRGHIDRHFAVGTAADDRPIAIKLEA